MTATAIHHNRPLNPAQQAAFEQISSRHAAAFNRLLDMIVPASAARGLPSAQQVGVLDYLRAFAPQTLPDLAAAFEALDGHSRTHHQCAFDALDSSRQQSLVDQLRTADSSFMQLLALETVSCYYQHPQVLAALAIEDRPPFPKGYQVIAGDLTLLEPVRRRGRVYREA